MNGGGSEHDLAAALADRRGVLDRQIGDRLNHASAKHTSACGSILRTPQQVRQRRFASVLPRRSRSREQV
jgi:hypothetical protein